ncbi:MAG TPA: hypothetical protein VFG14_13505 [Chthoniobacteraceae bacterium]|nr:hypothetical protein [Chthoniobacteraceae bacterium]
MPTTIDADSKVTETRTCPLCGTTLDAQNPNECPKCDWTLGYRRRHPDRVGTSRDAIAVVLSIIPGLGHMYKGHLLKGALLLMGGILAGFASALAATASAGFGLFLLPLYWAGVMLQVYWLEDRRAPAVTKV